MPPGEKETFMSLCLASGTVIVTLFRLTVSMRSRGEKQDYDGGGTSSNSSLLYQTTILAATRYCIPTLGDVQLGYPVFTVSRNVEHDDGAIGALKKSNQLEYLDPVEELLEISHIGIVSSDLDGDKKHEYGLVVLDVRNIWGGSI